MAAAEESAAAINTNANTNLDNIPEFIDEIFNPAPLPSFRESMPSGELEVHLHRGQGQEPRVIRLINIFPFMTLKDIKLAIYLDLKKDIIAVPEYIYLCLHGQSPGKKYIDNKTSPLDFSWNFPRISATNPLLLAEPFKLTSGGAPADARFVDSGGDRKLISSVDRERMTIEDACFKKGVSIGIPIIHAYFYGDLLPLLPGGNPPSEKEWNGRLYPMFPHLSVASGVAPTEALRSAAERHALIFLRRQQFMVKIESVLETNVPLVSLTMVGVKYLQLVWDAKQKIQGIETQFYEADVNERRPFIRLIPTEGYGLSKVYLSDGKVPDIQDPKLLVQWSQDRSPTPEQDFVFAKIMLRRGLINVAPIYGTLRLFNDGTADCVVEPPRGIKKLEPRNDLNSLGEQIVEGLRGLPYISEVPELGKGMLILGLRARKGADAIITPRILQERLPVFSAMFQEIAALPGENPLVMLRFKLVSNFAREDRIQTFLTQVINRKVLRGEGGVGDLINLVAEEFQIDFEEARKQVSTKLRNQGEVALVVAETKEYMRQNNPGIDIAIFSTHPFYTFHLYNVNSLENLRRIVTALSILISADSESLQVGVKAVKELLTAEAKALPVAPEAEAETEATEAAPEAEAALPVETEEAEDFGGADDMPDYLDYFAFDKDEESMTFEEAHQREVLAAAKIEGAALPEMPGASSDISASLKVAPTTKGIRKDIADGVGTPKEDLESILEDSPAAPVPTAPTAPTVTANHGAATGETDIANFFLKKLKDADSRLFDYQKSHPALKRYVSQCQPTYGRQPAVISEEKFQEIREEYEKDNISFQVYPLQPGEPEKLPGIPEVDYYTVLKYGSSPDKQNYYLCSKYFCARDEMLVREVDLQSRVMRRVITRADGSTDSTKLPGQCPFCKGTLIRNRQHPGPNETILERVIKPPTADKRHLFIGFLKKTPHPDGFYLPCCFTEDVPINFNKNPAFNKYKEWGTTLRPTNRAAAALFEDDEEAEEAPIDLESRTMIDYFTVLSQATKKYIVGAEKLPLDIGAPSSGQRGEAQIGLLPVVLNSYFDQDPTNIVSRAFNPQKIQPGGTGFLRVAVENRHRFQNDSFLAAVAPFYGKNTSLQMKQHILESIEPTEFLALNYGNLAIEFYDATDAHPKAEVARLWASNNLRVDMQQENEAAIIRAYMSYMAFTDWLTSDSRKKEYRQFALLFAQSNVLRKSYSSGITFIVLDILKNGEVKVRCPPYGFNAGLQNTNDVAFLLHHWTGIWEPIFYVDNRSAEVRAEIYTLVFQYAGRAAWPPIVGKRLQEFTTQCSSSGKSIYTSQSKMNSQAMIPASLARSILETEPTVIFDGVIRDAYNHIGALVFRERGGRREDMIALPVIDDGELYFGKNLYMDWEDPDFFPAPIDVLLRFYKKYIESRFAYYPGFVPVTIIKSEQSGIIEAIQLKNGLYVPASPPSTEDAATKLAGSPTKTIKEMEWTKNHEICLETGGSELPNETHRMSVVDFQEVFEHLRITFSNWLASREDGGEVRRSFEKVIFSSRLPLFEKRKRMEILVGREVEKWITTDYNDEDAKNQMNTSLLRVDCTVKGQDTCNGRCVWKQGKEESDGKCLLHVPAETELGEDTKKVSAPRVLLLRLIEELLRYGERRRQLFDQDVARLATLEKPVVLDGVGGVGKQVIFPEKSPAWYELLRLEWSKEDSEKPKFLEEMSRGRTEEPLAEQDIQTKLPGRLETLMNGPEGVDPKTGAIRLLRAGFESLLTPLRIRAKDIGIQEDTMALTDDMMRRIVEQTRGRVFQIDLREDPPTFLAKKPLRNLYEPPTVPVFIITETGPGILVLNPSAPEILQKEDMPAGLIAIMNKKFTEIKPTLMSRPGQQAPEVPQAQSEQPVKKTFKNIIAERAAAKQAAPRAPVKTLQQIIAQKAAAKQAAAATAQPPVVNPFNTNESEAAKQAVVATAQPPVVNPFNTTESEVAKNSAETNPFNEFSPKIVPQAPPL